jgi:hypothetical protein
MSRDATQRFRITGYRLFPDVRLPVASVRRYDEIILTRSGALQNVGQWETVELPPEAVLRELFDANLDTPEGVVSAVRELGWTDRSDEDLNGCGLTYPGARDRSADRKVWSPDKDLDFRDFLYISDNPTPDDLITFEILWEPLWWMVGGRLRAVRSLARHWIAYRQGNSVRPAWDEEGLRPRPDHRIPGSALEGIYGDSDGLAWSWFQTLLRKGLVHLQPTVTVSARRFGQGTYHYGRVTMETDSVGALTTQLFNLMHEDAPIRWCANEPCGRPFVHQRGRSAAGQYRTTGIKFCSVSCARAQAQRQYRRKHKR